MGIEDRMLANIDRKRERREELSPTIQQAHKVVSELFVNPRYAVQPDEFANLYGAENLAQDARKVHELEDMFSRRGTPQEQNAKVIADVFEGIVLINAALNRWLGDAEVLKTAPYDDYLNHTDMLAEWQVSPHESHALALSVDVTFGTVSIGRKFDEIYRRIDSDRAGEVKYFRTADRSFRGERSDVPQVVVGVNQQVVEELARLSLNNEKGILMGHPVQRILIEQIYTQLETAHQYALEHGKEKAAAAYAKPLRMLGELRKEKRAIPMAALAEDQVHVAIMRTAAERSSRSVPIAPAVDTVETSQKAAA